MCYVWLCLFLTWWANFTPSLQECWCMLAGLATYPVPSFPTGFDAHHQNQHVCDLSSYAALWVEDAGAAAFFLATSVSDSVVKLAGTHPDHTQFVVDLGASLLTLSLLAVHQCLFHHLSLLLSTLLILPFHISPIPLSRTVYFLIELKSLSLDCDKMAHDCGIIHMIYAHAGITLCHMITSHVRTWPWDSSTISSLGHMLTYDWLEHSWAVAYY